MNKIFGVFLCCLFISGCGGGDGQNAPSPTVSSQVKSSSSQGNSSLSSLSTSSVSFEEEVYSIDEDQPLVIERISIGYAEFTDENWNPIPWGAETFEGGNVKFHDSGITYTPKEDFFGKVEIYYRELKSNAEWKRFKVIINVVPVEDKSPRWKIGQVFEAGQLVELPLPLYPDTNQHLLVDDSVRLTLGEQQIPYHINGDKILFDFPVVDRAGFYDLSLGRVGDELVPIVNKSILITLDRGEVTYYIGNENSNGSFLVMVRNNNVTDERYADWLAAELVPFLYQPIVQAYQHYWSFAVISPAAERHLWFYTGVGVADASYYSLFVNQSVPRNTEIIVMDGGYFRATGGYPIAMNVRDNAFVLFHEIAHAHAKLGDEYEENCDRGEYQSKLYPNVEHAFLGGVDNIQWKHWIEDPLRIPGQATISKNSDEIGVFLGAYYCSNKYYRPAHSTLMRVRDKNISSVDKEAWALANYENMDFLNSLEGEQKNGVNKLWIKKSLDPALTSIRWFLNDEALPEFDGARQIEIDESTIQVNRYSVTAELLDLTGTIRNPHAYNAFNEQVFNEEGISQSTGINPSFRKTWEFTKVASSIQRKPSRVFSQVSSDQWVQHNIRIDTKGHQLLKSSIQKIAHTIKPVTGASDLMAEIVVGSSVLVRQGIELERFHMPEIAPLNNRFYTLVHPVLNEPYQIKIYSLPVRELVAVFDISSH